MEDIHKSFGNINVLNGVNLNIEKGFIYTLRGENGSGKTTLINVISGYLKPEKGNIDFKGNIITRYSPYRLNRLGIGRTFQDLRLASQLTVYENILLAMEKKIFSFPTEASSQRIDEILEKVSLNEKKNELAGNISYGQQKLLTLGCCIANNADLLLIDEPVAGIDKDNRLKIISLIKKLKKEGKTIMQIEHDSEYIEATSDRILQMGKGIIKC